MIGAGDRKAYTGIVHLGYVVERTHWMLKWRAEKLGHQLGASTLEQIEVSGKNG